MKCVIPLVFFFALVGCDQATDTASLDASDKIQPQVVGKATNNQSKGLKAQVFQFGIYKATKKGRITDSTETNTGKIVRKPTLEHVLMTDRIPLVKETYFGYQFRLWNLPPEVMIKPVMQLRKVLIHPEMTLPDGSKTTGWDHTFKGRVETQQVMGFDGYGFNEDYELVEGDWIFQIWYKDKKLIERKFVSVWPEQGKTAEVAEKE
ncbi:MAG TPA: DUF3859 domain-containing protein [Mizugakiibacter sp.]|nr:DUF3859 domain-containing protein [Mizugakiibacter sp.]